MSDQDITYAHPPYTPMVSLRHELGIMFGFAAACILTVGVYYVFWQSSQRRAAARDDARSKDLRARGFHHERGGYHDKALGRYASRDPVAQTQGQTLEFLTAPDQFNSSSNNSNINGNATPAEDAVYSSSSSSSRVPVMRGST
ncbi:hypothetical protein PISL3812_01067 [Talaromyces islandicus]|uniref:Uncharacterized protein n=1 Tax=Talaromyces islandicus TaxID=28573 RepID=A0A0U1LLP3_TALIS|nr:hypothetical protein PISL3812_01067 [Talaromyces islandicus]